MRIAIVGTGVAGMVAAHKLHPEHEIVVYEAAERLGGHSNTVEVEDATGGRLAIDTGFIVFNDRNYPNFEALLAELGVESQRSHMGFSVSNGGRFEYSGTPWGLFARPAHLVSPSFLGMLRDWRRFNHEAKALIGMNGTAPSLGVWLEQKGFSQHFIDRLIVPQASAVWSADPEQMWSFPASFMAEFFDNHGMYSLRDRPKWRTVTGGSRSYVEAISAPWRDRVRLGAAVRRIERLPGGVRVEAEGCEAEELDQVVIATHSDQALAMLADPSEPEREVLGSIPFQRNEAVLHTDKTMLPRRRTAWSSWNFHLAAEPRAGSTVTYWMNSLQRLRAKREYLVTLNRGDEIDPEKVLRRFEYDHPVYTAEGVAAQGRHAEISGVRRTHYCGAYWGWGFHEDGVVSALRACEGIAAAAGAARRSAAGARHASSIEAPMGAQNLESLEGELAA
ncbi:MAG TPA: FAD-dependent oxidoreductase [Solirubrobacterales bacterium]|jgi:predicted NAD/FAD-binding protein|nr:FAD-dependent oxidoreductase [Solirubrobacterales bacterium]